MRFSIFQDSHQGGRKRNEDSMGYSYTSDSLVMVVADGLGGHPEGEVASRLALKTVVDRFKQQAKPRLTDVAAFLEDALLAANQALLDYASAHQLMDAPRTTLVAAVVQEGCVIWLHCGDSRMYLLRSGAVLARTLDHSLVERDRQLGRVGVHAFPGNRNALYTCVGSVMQPIFNLAGPVVLRPEDRVVLCSDGLWSVVPEETIVKALGQTPVHKAVPALLARALKNGGPHGDNVTCLAMAWEDQGDFEATQHVGLSVQPSGLSP